MNTPENYSNEVPSWYVEPGSFEEYQLISFANMSERLAVAREGQTVAEGLATTDQMTGLLNKMTFEQQARDSTLETRRLGEQDPVSKGHCLLLIDIDRFKEVNDIWGHQTGDKLIVGVASRIEAETRKGDIAGRTGSGDEFGVVLVNTPVEGAVAYAARLRRALQELAHPLMDHVTASIGIAEMPYGGNYADAAKAADQGLYEVKRNGRDGAAITSLDGEAGVTSRQVIG